MNDLPTKDPLKMRQLGPDGLFVLPEQDASDLRKQYLRRCNRILAAYSVIAAYADQGKKAVDQLRQAKRIEGSRPVRFDAGPFIIQSTFDGFASAFQKAGRELTNQFTVAIYGSFEAFLADLVLEALKGTSSADPHFETLALIGQTKWKGKIDRISQKFELSLGRNRLRRRYDEMEMDFFGRSTDDPVEMLQAFAEVRHRIVHYDGRADAGLVKDFPSCGLRDGDPISFPFEIPYVLHFFLIPLSDEFDGQFSKRCGWPRARVRPEELLP